MRIQILGVNWFGLESANEEMVAGTSLPWLQDLDANGDGHSDVWMTWGTDHLDLVMLDASNRPVAIANLGALNLDVAANYAALRDYLVASAMASQKPWQNPDDPFDVDNNGIVTPLDALIIINRINDFGAHLLPPPTDNQAPPPYYDTSGDGSLAPIDALLVINYLNAEAGTGLGEGESTERFLDAGIWGNYLVGTPAANSPGTIADAFGYRWSPVSAPPAFPTVPDEAVRLGPGDSRDMSGEPDRGLPSRKVGGGGRVARVALDLPLDDIMADGGMAAILDILPTTAR